MNNHKNQNVFIIFIPYIKQYLMVAVFRKTLPIHYQLT